MKKSILTLLLVLSVNSIWSQAPNKMSYQAVVRDADNNLVSNQSIGMKISILSAAPDGTSVYEETHNINSNMNGLVSIIIGEGNNASGSFAAINWTSTTHYIKTEIDPNGGSNYTITGLQQLLSVPYALHANTADNLGGVEGTEVGEMLFWDGDNWVTVSPATNGQFLSFCNGKPTWGLCLETTIGGPISATTGIVNGRLSTDVGDTSIVERGICYSTSPNPTTQDVKIVSSSNNSTWGMILTGLIPNTTYYIRAYIENNSGIEYGNEISFTTSATLGVGDYFPEEGGVIFYILQPGDTGYDPNTVHGLIVSTQYPDPFEFSNWGCMDTLIGTSNEIGSGLSNTNMIVSGCNETPIPAQVCQDFSLGGFDDWYLGSLEEMLILSSKKYIVNTTLGVENFQSMTYTRHWTSSESDAGTAFNVYFSGTTPSFSAISKLQQPWISHEVRPIRSF